MCNAFQIKCKKDKSFSRSSCLVLILLLLLLLLLFSSLGRNGRQTETEALRKVSGDGELNVSEEKCKAQTLI